MSTATVTITVKLLNGDLLTLCGEESMPGEALYREVYTLLDPDVAPPPLEAWRMMLLRNGTWIAPSRDTAHLQDGEVLDLWIESGEYHVTVECYGCITGFMLMRLNISGSIDAQIPFYINEDTGRWFYPYEMITEGNVRWRNEKARRGRYDYRFLVQGLGPNPCVEEYIFACVFCLFYDMVPANADIEPALFVRGLVEAAMQIE